MSGNITQVNITIPSGFTFLGGSNATDALGSTFVNTSTVLSWTNTSILLIGNVNKSFSFNLTCATPGDYNITITSVNGSGSQTNSLNVTINDTTAPATVTSINPLNEHNYSGVLVFNATVTDNGVLQNFIFNISNSSGDIVNSTYATNTSQTAWNISVDTSNFLEGIYNVTLVVNDTYGNKNNSHFIRFRIDNTVPNVTAFTSTTNNGNYSQNITLNITAADGKSGLGSAYFNLTNSSGKQVAFVGRGTISGSTMSVNYNTSSLTDGAFNITVYVNDTANNINNTERIQVTIDNTDPSASFTCTPSSVSLTNVVTCGCSPSDSLSGVNSTATSFTKNPSTSDTGSFSISCSFADLAGNIATVSTSYEVTGGGAGGGGSGGGSSSFYTKTIYMNTKEFSEVQAITQHVQPKQKINIKIGGKTHYVGVKSVSLTKATIEIASDPVSIELEAGEDAKVDVNDDGFYDVYVKLKAIVNGKADLEIKYLHEEIPAVVDDEGQETKPPVETTGDIIEPEVEPEEEKSYAWIIWVLVIVVVLVIAYYVFMKNNSKGKK